MAAYIRMTPEVQTQAQASKSQGNQEFRSTKMETTETRASQAARQRSTDRVAMLRKLSMVELAGCHEDSGELRKARATAWGLAVDGNPVAYIMIAAFQRKVIALNRAQGTWQGWMGEVPMPGTAALPKKTQRHRAARLELAYYAAWNQGLTSLCRELKQGAMRICRDGYRGARWLTEYEHQIRLSAEPLLTVMMGEYFAEQVLKPDTGILAGVGDVLG